MHPALGCQGVDQRVPFQAGTDGDQQKVEAAGGCLQLGQIDAGDRPVRAQRQRLVALGRRRCERGHLAAPGPRKLDSHVTEATQPNDCYFTPLADLPMTQW